MSKKISFKRNIKFERDEKRLMKKPEGYHRYAIVDVDGDEARNILGAIHIRQNVDVKKGDVIVLKIE